MAVLSPGPPEAAPRPTRVAAELVDGRARFSVLDQGDHLAPRPLNSAAAGFPPSHLRLALIGISMMLLGGDDVVVEVSLGPGVTLEITEPAGVVAYNSDGRASHWAMRADLNAGSTLVWEGATFVAALGSNVRREIRVDLGTGARALMQEVLVLGRSGETGGQLRNVSRFTGADGDYLYEDLDLTGARQRAVGILGGSKVMTSLTAIGWRPGTGAGSVGGTSIRRLELAGKGAVLRALTAEAHEGHYLTTASFCAWRSEAVATAEAQ